MNALRAALRFARLAALHRALERAGSAIRTTRPMRRANASRKTPALL
jgi:hypothetical protein